MHLADWLNNGVITFTFIADPPGLLPLFLSLTAGMTAVQRRQTALLASLVSFGLIALFIVTGEYLLAAMNISMGAFWLAGGLLLFCIAFKMVFSEDSSHKNASAGAAAITRDHMRNIAVFPLATPLITGPGFLSAAILMAGKHSGIGGMAASLAAAAVAIGICFLFMLLAIPLDKIIGNAGRFLLTKLFGILLAAMAAQFAADGIHALMQ